MSTKWYANKGVTTAIHAICWLLLFSLPYLFRPSFDYSKEVLEQNRDHLIVLGIINRILWVGLFYLNTNVIVPKFLYKGRKDAFALILLLIIVGLLFIDWGLFDALTQGLAYSIRNFFSFNFLPIILILAASTTFRVITDLSRAEKMQREKVTENLKTELSLLRSQVSPHFMFNVLNNMVALARKGSDQLEPSLIKLSSLLRYMLYETNEKVQLRKEIEYLQSYIDLQQQRFGRNVLIKTCMQQVDAPYEIEPMLLIPFVENAFKHGTGMIEKAEIDTELKAERGILTLSVRNKFNPASTEIKDEASGIGLANVQRRLDLLYAQNHSLLITRQDNWFIVSLQIVLK